jgi:histidinol-phosphate/aromatic aminotransferase/cobyric acid decarboxylase-like protein
MGNGAAEIIQAIIHNFVKQKILIILPTFSSYYEFIKPRVEVVYYYLDQAQNFELDIDKYLQFVNKEKPNTVVLINPNNPTGNYIPFAKIEYLLSEMKSVDNIIIDESFIHFTFEDENYNFRSTEKLVNDYNNLIIIKSMSKDFGIAGIRAGYAVMNEIKVNKLLKNGYLWNLSGLAEYFFNLYTDNEFIQAYETARIQYIKDAQRFFWELGKVNSLKAYPSKANFILMELIDGSKGIDFVAKMLIKHGIYTRTCNDKKGLERGEFIRIAARKEPENQIIINAIGDVFS